MKIRGDEGTMMNGNCFSLPTYADDIVLLGKEKRKVVDLCDRIGKEGRTIY